ncbi:MAG: CPBP family intramembrane metalloprotease [Actinomycetota bacterium]|nr:CPBP family intramembrane metalloprotease [Actinomycetota bacterium]
MLDQSPSPDARPDAPTAYAVPWTGWDLVGALCVGLALGVAGAFVGFLIVRALGADPSVTTSVSIASVVIYAALGGAAWGFALRRRNATFADAGFRWVGVGPLLLTLPLVVVLMLATYAVLTVTAGVVGDVPTAQEQVAPGETSLLPADLLWLLLAGAIAAPLVEEFIFRGLLFPYLRARKGVAFAVIASAALFAVLHFVPPLIPALFVFGIVQALVAYRLKSIYPAIALHALNNGILLLAVYVTLAEG